MNCKINKNKEMIAINKKNLNLIIGRILKKFLHSRLVTSKSSYGYKMSGLIL